MGMMMVSIIMKRRSAMEESRPDPWLEHNVKMLEAGAEALPGSVHPSIEKGVILDFGYLPSEDAAEEKVWLLNFEESYPYVRVVQNLSTQEVTYMAADQISIKLAEGVDATELKPMLDELGLRLRNFNRKEQLVVLGVLSKEVGAVPATIAAVQPWGRFFASVEPDWLKFQPQKPGK